MFFFCRCSDKPLYGIAVCDVTNICFVYLASSSFTLLLKAACVFFLFSFLWSDAFYQSNRLAAVFEWPGPHTHTSQSVQTENKCTDNQRERDEWGGEGTQAQVARSGPGLAEPEPFGKVTLTKFTCTFIVHSLVELTTKLSAEALINPVTELVWCRQ